MNFYKSSSRDLENPRDPGKIHEGIFRGTSGRISAYVHKEILFVQIPRGIPSGIPGCISEKRSLAGIPGWVISGEIFGEII